VTFGGEEMDLKTFLEILGITFLVGLIILLIWSFFFGPAGCGGHYYWDAVNQTCRWTGVG